MGSIAFHGRGQHRAVWGHPRLRGTSPQGGVNSTDGVDTGPGGVNPHTWGRPHGVGSIPRGGVNTRPRGVNPYTWGRPHVVGSIPRGGVDTGPRGGQPHQGVNPTEWSQSRRWSLLQARAGSTPASGQSHTPGSTPPAGANPRPHGSTPCPRACKVHRATMESCCQISRSFFAPAEFTNLTCEQHNSCGQHWTRRRGDCTEREQ